MKNLVFLSLIIFPLFVYCQDSNKDNAGERWSVEKAWEWHKKNGWMAGTNFNPSTAINQLEFFQKETFDISFGKRYSFLNSNMGNAYGKLFIDFCDWAPLPRLSF